MKVKGSSVRGQGEVLGMFSEALIQLDRNDAKYYADTLRKKAAKLEAELESNRAELRSKDDEIAELRKSKDGEIAKLRKKIEQLESRR